jgi:hypothetical protein
MKSFCLAALLAAGAALSTFAADPPHRHAPHLVAHQIADSLAGGYMVVVTDLNHDGKPDVLAIASQLKDVLWFENPTWARHVVVTGIDNAINADAYDVDGDGIPEIALAYRFSMSPATSLGVVAILTHRGDPREPWSMQEIDRLPTTHRIRWADIDGSGRKVLVDAALVGPGAQAPDYHGATPLVLYRPGAWKRETIAETDGLVHGLFVTDWSRRGRDAVITAGFSGVHVDELTNGMWKRSELTSGDPSPWPKSGVSDFAAVRFGSERLFATIEPWHGNQIAIYRLDNGAWMRHVIDAEPTDLHTIVAADFDGSGRDSIVAGERRGKRSVYLYSARDDRGLEWDKEVLDDAMPASGCAAADLNGDRRVDIVCIGGGTLRWYENVPAR